MTSTLTRRITAAAATLVVAAGAGLATSDVALAGGSHSAKVHTTIKLDKSKHHLVGKLGSSKHACVKNKKVSVHWKQPGVKTFRVVAIDKTSTKGAWSVHDQGNKIPKGQYYVTVNKSSTCSSVHSKKITVR